VKESEDTCRNVCRAEFFRLRSQLLYLNERGKVVEDFPFSSNIAKIYFYQQLGNCNGRIRQTVGNAKCV
jgi:hypothetical protein